MKRGKARFKFFGVCAAAVLYVIFFPALAGKELFLLPAWTVDVEDAQPVSRSLKEAEEFFPFNLSGYIGYADSQGKLLFRENLAYGAAMGRDSFVNYPAFPLNLLVRDRQGNFLGNIAGGYPFMRGDKLFLLSPNGYGLSLVSRTGDTLWERKFASLITVADAGEEETVVGLLNGKTVVLGGDGSVEYETSISEQGLAVTLQTGIADDGLYFIEIGGVNPQRLRLFMKQEDTYTYTAIFQAELPSSYRRALVARYFSEPDYFIFEQPGGAGFFEVEKEKLLTVPLSGQLLALAGERPCGLFLFVAEKDDRLYFTACLPDGSRVFGFSYAKPASQTGLTHYLYGTETKFLLGAGTGLYCVDLGVF